MPRLEFRNSKEMERWLKVLGKVEKYIGYYSSNAELIVIPKTSTSPILYGIVENVTKEECTQFGELLDMKILPIRSITWNSESTPIVQ